MNPKPASPKLYISMPHDCSYLPERMATIVFVDPNTPAFSPHYRQMAKSGFRRSGNLVYRPHCEDCHECIAVRVPTATFKPNRSQRRVWTRNQDLVIKKVSPKFSEEHFALYQHYQQVRHTNSSMDSGDPNQYNHFLFGDVTQTEVLEFRLHADLGSNQELLAVSIIDILDDGLSAVYSFFNPSMPRRALGVYSVLYEIHHARQLDLPYVYLGYYIAESRKMNYKIKFQPIEGFDGKNWKILNS